MTTARTLRIFLPPFLTLALAFTLAFRGAPARAAELADELYGAPKLLALKIELPAPALDALRKAPKTYVKGTVREGDKVYANVGVRLRGASSVQWLDKKPDMQIKFDEFESGQFFHGHEKIALDSSVSDASYLAEAIGGEIFRAAGVPAVRVTFARVDLNGRDLGLYVIAQTMNRDFLSDHFKKTRGNFYIGKSADVTEKLDLDGGNTPKDQSDLKNLAAAAREADPNQRLKKLGTVLDTDRFLSYLAAEIFTWQRHGYALGRNNYRLYYDPIATRLNFLPEPTDELFTKPTGALMPECRGIVARTFFESADGQKLYRERMTKLLGTAFKPDALVARVNDLAAKIKPAAARDAVETKAFDSAVAQLRDGITQRAKFLEDELKKPAK